MTALGWITLGTTIGIVSPLIYLRARNRPPGKSAGGSADRKHPAPPGPTPSSPYAAVSIYPCLEACPAAWKIQGERFLAGQVPKLPLAECDQATCSCSYREHEDRRTGEERRDMWGHFGGFRPHHGDDKRQSKQDRRN